MYKSIHGRKGLTTRMEPIDKRNDKVYTLEYTPANNNDH